MNNQYITQHFSWNEMTRSQKRGKDTAIIVTSCFRSERVNALVGGSPTSAHRFGLAVDFDIQGMTLRQSAELVEEMAQKGLIEFDQLILEFPENGLGAWMHFGLRDGSLRHQILTATKQNGKTVYLQCFK